MKTVILEVVLHVSREDDSADVATIIDAAIAEYTSKWDRKVFVVEKKEGRRTPNDQRGSARPAQLRS